MTTLEYWFMFPISILIATTAMASGIGGATLRRFLSANIEHLTDRNKEGKMKKLTILAVLMMIFVGNVDNSFAFGESHFRIINGKKIYLVKKYVDGKNYQHKLPKGSQ